MLLDKLQKCKHFNDDGDEKPELGDAVDFETHKDLEFHTLVFINYILVVLPETNNLHCS